MTRFDVSVRGGVVVTPRGPTRLDIAIEDGAIVKVRPEIRGTAQEVIEADRLHVHPGAVATHVYFNEPVRTDCKGWTTGSTAQAPGARVRRTLPRKRTVAIDGDVVGIGGGRLVVPAAFVRD
jgi:dihydroorotase-like cyclic amidohydrolase